MQPSDTEPPIAAPSKESAFGGLPATAYSSMFQAVNGLRNRRALAAMLGCTVAGVLVAGLCVLLATRMGFFFAFLGGLFMFVASATGINAAGVLLMDQARGVPMRALRDAVVFGAACIPKFIALALCLMLAAAAVFIALAIVLVICKIPFLGPILYVVVFPLSVLMLGLTLCGLFLCMFLVLPAIWEGTSLFRAIAQTFAIAHHRLVESVLLLAVVGVLAGCVGFVVFGVLFSGLVPSISLSAGILGGGGMGSVMGLMRHGNDFADDGSGGASSVGAAASYAMAGGIGLGLLWSLAGSLVSLVSLLGLNLVYLRVTEGLDVEGAQAALKSRFADARRQAADLGQKAREAAERAQAQGRHASGSSGATDSADASVSLSSTTVPFRRAPSPAVNVDDVKPRAQKPESTAPSVAKALICPQCLSPVSKDDAFCGVCGHRLT